MARKEKDVFGIEELQKEFAKMEKKYPNKADALLMAEGRTVNKRVKQLTPVYKGPPLKNGEPGDLKRSWRLKPVKLYKDGTVRVVRVENKAPHAHLIEEGHEIYHGKGRGNRGVRSKRKLKKAFVGKRTHAYKLLETAMKETESHFQGEVKKMFDDLIKDVEV